MSTKCTSQNCNRKAEPPNNQNLCILCYDWFQKCQDLNQASQHPQNLANSQELSSIYNNLANEVSVDPNLVMRAFIRSMMNLMNQNVEIVQFKEEISVVTNNVKGLDEFTTRDSIVITNVPVPNDGDDHRVVKEAFAQLNIKDAQLIIERGFCPRR